VIDIIDIRAEPVKLAPLGVKKALTTTGATGEEVDFADASDGVFVVQDTRSVIRGHAI